MLHTQNLDTSSKTEHFENQNFLIQQNVSEVIPCFKEAFSHYLFGYMSFKLIMAKVEVKDTIEAVLLNKVRKIVTK